jgi:hypothetical protein
VYAEREVMVLTKENKKVSVQRVGFGTAERQKIENGWRDNSLAAIRANVQSRLNMHHRIKIFAHAAIALRNTLVRCN